MSIHSVLAIVANVTTFTLYVSYIDHRSLPRDISMTSTVVIETLKALCIMPTSLQPLHTSLYRVLDGGGEDLPVLRGYFPIVNDECGRLDTIRSCNAYLTTPQQLQSCHAIPAEPC